jgi:hypothetical protein
MGVYMKNIGYMVDRILSMNILGVFDVANKVHKKTKRNRIIIIIDIIWCGLRHMAGYVDYLIFEMYNLNEHQRSTVMTRGRNNAYVRELNNPKYNYMFESKKDFHNLFNDLVKRDWLSLEDASFDDFEKFVIGKENFFAKPNRGTCGRGIEKIVVSDYEDIYTLWYHLHDRKCTLIEETIIQHPTLKHLHPHSINTIRFVTILHKNNVHLVSAYLRIGNNRIVDNFNSGGMVVPIDLKTGFIHDVAIDKAGNYYQHHPLTKTRIQGFQVPCWDESLTLVIEAAKRVEQIRLVGWDVGISENGPLLVEANQYPGHDIYQLPLHTPKKIGMLPVFQEIIKLK